MPISVAAPLSSATASIACPARVLLMKPVSATMIIKQTAIAATVSPEMTSCPFAKLIDLIGTTERKLFGFAPKMSSARFCNK